MRVPSPADDETGVFVSPFEQLIQAVGRTSETYRLGISLPNTGFRTTMVSHDQLEAAITGLTQAGADVWWEVQPSHYAGGKRSSAEHVAEVKVLYADLDFKPKPQGLSSLPEAMDVVADLEGALGVPAAAIVHSGHGIQPYWLFEGGLITTDEDRSRMAILLRRWGRMVADFAANQHGGVDNVFDLPRILRVPGSVNHKGKPVPVTVDIRPNPVALDAELLAEAFEDYEVAMPTSDHLSGAAEIVSPSAEWNWASHDCSFCSVVREEIVTSDPGSRHHWGLKWAALLAGMVRYGCMTEATHAELQTALITRFHYLVENTGTRRKAHSREVVGILRAGLAKAESWDDVKLAEEMRQHMHEETFAALVQASAPEQPTAPAPSQEPGPMTAAAQPDAPASAPAGIFAQLPQPTVEFTLEFGSMTDYDNANKLAKWIDGRFIHVAGVGWLRWTGYRYEEDKAGLIMEEAKRMTLALGAASHSEKQLKWAHSSLSKGRLAATIDLARTVETINVEPTALDVDAEVLNTPDGIVDLRAGTLRRPDPRTDRNTLATAVAPTVGPHPRWDAFLTWAMAEETMDGERCRYMQRLLGAALIGEVRWHIFPVWVGSGRNGKSVIIDVVMSLLDSYAHMLPRKFFVEKRGESHPTDIAGLRGRRVAFASEVPRDAAFDEDLVKQVTGEARLTGRFMRQDFFTFRNQATYFLAANHLPTVKAGGDGFWRRVRKIDFPNQIAPGDENPYLPQELVREEGPAILAWMIEGAVAVIAGGPQDPQSVLQATREYRMQEDAIARFLNEQIIEMPEVKVSRDLVYDQYRRWSMANGTVAMPSPAFEREVGVARPGSAKAPGVYTGLALASSLVDELTEAADA